jgi:hypothetical protein
MQAVDLDMLFLQKAFRGRYLIVDAERGILGRDVLASVILLFNGPAQEWSQQLAAPWKWFQNSKEKSKGRRFKLFRGGHES